jgi:hypothetical protein
MQSPPPEQTTPWLTPGRAFLFSSLPLGIGTYIGYRRALSESVEITTTSLQNNLLGRKNSIVSQMIHAEPPSAGQTTAQIKINAPLLAVRALAIGSLLSISGTSLLISSLFYASDAHSVDDLITKWRIWAPKKLKQLEVLLGVKESSERAESREYEREVRGMSEEEEWDWVKNRYGGEIQWDADEEDEK